MPLMVLMTAMLQMKVEMGADIAVAITVTVVVRIGQVVATAVLIEMCLLGWLC